ncbi:MAG: hypothetical protein DI592_22290, partial [Stenotrophomonas maltophilia]
TTGGEPTALPEYFRQMGYITTAGVTQGNDVSSTDTNMDQDVEPVVIEYSPPVVLPVNTDQSRALLEVG